MIKNIFIILSILILNSCSFDTKSGIWTKEKISLESKENNRIKELFKKKISNENEFNPKLEVVIKNFSENRNQNYSTIDRIFFSDKKKSLFPRFFPDLKKNN